MKKPSIDLSTLLEKYTSGWVAIDENENKVVAHAATFSKINMKLEKKGINTTNIVLIPAAENYFGFIT